MKAYVGVVSFMPLGKEFPGTHWIGSWVGPRASLDDMEKRKIGPY
jgi:hypothetical protein